MKKKGPKKIIFILDPSSIFEFKVAQKSGLLLPIPEHHSAQPLPQAIEVVAVSEKDLLYFGFMMLGMSVFRKKRKKGSGPFWEGDEQDDERQNGRARQ